MIVVVIKVNAQTDLDIVPVLRRPHTDQLMCKSQIQRPFAFIVNIHIFIVELIGKSRLPSTVPLVTISESCQCTLAQTDSKADQRLALPAEIEVRICLQRRQFFCIKAKTDIQLVLPHSRDGYLGINGNLPINSHAGQAERSRTARLIIVCKSQLPFQGKQSVPTVHGSTFSPHHQSVDGLFGETCSRIAGDIHLYQYVGITQILTVFLLSLQIDDLPEDVFHRFQLGSLKQRTLHIHPDNVVGPHGKRHIYRIVIHHSTVHQHHSIQVYRSKHTGNGHAGTHGSGQYSLMEHYFAAIHQIFRHAGKWNRKTAKIHRILVTFCQRGEQTCQVLPFYDTRIRNSGRFQRKRNGEYIALRLQPVIQQHILRIGGIREQEFPVLGIQHTVQLLWGISDRIQTAHNGPHTSAHHIIYRDTRFFNYFQSTDMRRPFGATPTEYDSHFRTPGRPKDHRQKQQTSP